eukprot:tig00000492_g1494.t1
MDVYIPPHDGAWRGAGRRTLVFADVAREAAALIRAGGLRIEDDEYSQVEPASYEPLARINELGLVTFDSQDARPSAGDTERPYVEGFMLPGAAEAFVDAFNASTDKVALLLHPSSDHAWASRVIVTRRGDGHPESWQQLRIDPESYAWQQRRMGLRPGGSLLVACIDPKWGRRATGPGGLFGDVVRVLEGLAGVPPSRSAAAARVRRRSRRG